MALAALARSAASALDEAGLLAAAGDAAVRYAREPLHDCRVAAARAAARLASHDAAHGGKSCSSAFGTVMQALLGPDQSAELQRQALVALRRLAQARGSESLVPHHSIILPCVTSLLQRDPNSQVRSAGEAALRRVEMASLAASPGLQRLAGASDVATRAFQGLGGYIRNKSTLDGRLRELAILQVGWLARSPYEWSHHVKIGHDFGVSEADIQALIDDTAGKPTPLGAVERCVLRAAREMTVEGAASDATFKELQGHFSTEHLTDLVVTIAFYCAVVRFLATMQIDVEPEYQPYLDRWPLPKD